ncbi:uncharacterized protein FSUBG_7905 [Fusarium subglutinans]|uniref:Uncharacterized protein n=1 Tax=Gibberella subglutinans TaxID=42677 RepID=A0A8H5PS31_GIBSU|nr:uncharacterized protein FSUBG_7905 [Fusarium subglutinans]KAF5602070.1 hypothetical protein FSUBG_7905 [Fusarium subglutinans]
MGYVLLAPYNDSMHLGQGFNSFLQRPCIDGAVKLTQADLQTQAARAGGPSNVSQVVSYSSRFVEKISDVVRSMNISAASSIKLGTIEVSGNSLSIDEAKFAGSDMNAVISVKVINQITTAVQNPTFLPLEKSKNPSDPPQKMTSERFFKIYGDSYISGFMEGGDLHGIVSMKVLDASKKSNVETALKGAMNGSAGEFTLSEGTATSTIEAAVQETESTITVNWSGGGQIKSDDAEWTLDSLIRAASAFPGRVAACPQKTYAILTPYNRNRSFVKWAEENNITVPDFSPVQQYTHDLLDSFMEFKSNLGRIQAVIANPLAYGPSRFNNPVNINIEALVTERQAIKKEMAKIVGIIDKLNSNPSELITEEVQSPEVWAFRLPVLIESTVVDTGLSASQTARIVNGFCDNDPTQDTIEPPAMGDLENEMKDSVKNVQDKVQEKEKEIKKEAPAADICSDSIKEHLIEQELAFVDDEDNKRKYSQYRFDRSVGKPTGGFFVDAIVLEKAMFPVSWPESIEIRLRVWGNGKVKLVRTMYQQTHQTHGTNSGETQTSMILDLEEGEVVNLVKLGKGNAHGGMTGVGFVELQTSKSRKASVGSEELCDEVIECAPYDGCTGLKGFWGGKGDLIDRLGPIWGKQDIYLTSWAGLGSLEHPLLSKSFGSLDETSISCQYTHATMEWIVENFQVPVPLGDCSIHVLIKNRKSVEYAFIMDGGVDSGEYSASEAILLALGYVNKYLGTHYSITKNIQFNLWVVTHWDADHFRGMMELIGEFTEKPKKQKKTTKTKKKNKGGIEEEKEEVVVALPKPTARMAEIFVKDPKLYCGRLEEPFTSQVTKLGFKLTGGASALGLDMLSGVKIFNTDGKLEPSVLDKRRPRFCIIGADGSGISVPKFQQGVNRNQSSILAVLFWPENDGQCCFYAGGDGFPELERKVINEFLKKSSIVKLGNGLDLMKLDHHGSSQENIYGGDLRDVKSAQAMKLANMPVGIFKAKNFLVTPGNLHGHPTYDVVWCLVNLLRSATGVAEDGRPNGRVWTTRSPYWATKKALTTKDLSAYHNKDLQEIHEKDLQAYNDYAKKELDIGMLLAAEAQLSQKHLDRANALKTWKKKILQQAAILGADVISLELDNIERTMPSSDEEEDPKSINAIQEEKKPKRKKDSGKEEEEITTSTQIDYTDTIHDDVMNIRFGAHEMWSHICNQGVVPAHIDPFFIVHFRWVNAVFEQVEYLGRDGSPKVYEPEPSVPLRQSLRQLAKKKAQEQKSTGPPLTESKAYKMEEELLVIPLTKQDGLFYVDEESSSFHDSNNQEKGPGSGINLSMSDISVPMGEYKIQALEDYKVFTNISESSGQAIDKMKGISSKGSYPLQLGNSTFKTDFWTVASFATGTDKMLPSDGNTMTNIGSTFKTEAQFEKSAATESTFIRGLKAFPGSGLQFEEDEDEDEEAESSMEEEVDEDYVSDASWEDEDGEVDKVLKELETLQKDYKGAFEKSKSPRTKGKRQQRTLDRMANGVSRMKEIRKEAEKKVAAIDPAMFFGDVDETSQAMMEKLLVMAITYIPPTEEKNQGSGEEDEGNSGEEQTTKMTKNRKEKAKMKIEEEKKDDVEDDSNLGKRQWKSGKGKETDNSKTSKGKKTNKSKSGNANDRKKIHV